jgi:hypothetical protein
MIDAANTNGFVIQQEKTSKACRNLKRGVNSYLIAST